MARRFQKMSAGYFLSSTGRTDSSSIGAILVGQDWAVLADGIKLLEVAPDDTLEVGVSPANGIILSVGTEAADVIRVTGQAIDSEGVVLKGSRLVQIRTVPVGIGTPLMAVFTGTNVKNNGGELWMDTSVDGIFAVDITDTSAEIVVVSAVLDDGTSAFTKINFT